MTDRPLPHNVEAERAVLGGLLIDATAFYDVAPFLTARDFFSGNHAAIFDAMTTLMRRDMPLDHVTIAQELRGKPIADLDGLLVSLALAVPSSVMTRHYGQIVAELSRRRALIRAGGAIASAAWDEAQTIDAVTADANRALFDAITAHETRGTISAKEMTARMLDRLEDGPRAGLATGLVDLDRVLDGLHRTDLYILAGRPGMGKSSMEGSIARHVALHGGTVVRFNLEMGREQMLYRDVSALSRVDFQKIRRNDLNEHERLEVAQALGKLSECAMFYDDTPAISPLQLESRCRQLAMGRDVDLITVDYMQLMKPDTSYGNRVQDVGAVSRALKGLAKSLDVPILALAQLSRAVEQRADKRPQLADLRDSGEIEQDADAVIFAYRDDYYYEDSATPNQIELIVSKHRHGANGTVRLYWNAGKVGNLAQQPSLNGRR